jgi:Gpi18-like mannosyltransferase
MGKVILIAILSTLAVWGTVGMKTVYENFDGPYYLVVAKAWYDKDVIRHMFSFSLPLEYYPAHFPLYPLLIDLFNLTNLNRLQAMVVVNLLATVIGTGVIYKIFEKQKWGDPFWITLTWLFWWPRMWAVRSVGSPETLFILAIITSLYFFTTKKYLYSGIAGSLAVLTKSPGALLFVAYGIWFVVNFIKTKKWEVKIWPMGLIGLTFLGLFYFFFLKTGDFWAYFHTGDNIHLQAIPFKIFDTTQPWVGSIWLEEIIWIYLIAGIGVFRALKKDLVWGIFGSVFYILILFVSHRDVARYSLPLIPVVLLGISEIFSRKDIRWALGLVIIPLFFYTINFVLHNTVAIADWGPLL